MASNNKLLLGLFLCLLGTVAMATTRSPRIMGTEQCRLQRLTTSQPFQRIDSEGGFIERWNENEDQFRCVGVAPMRKTLRPNALHLPFYHPYPRLAYIERGEGYIGVHYPGCPETFTEGGSQQESFRGREGRRGERMQEEHHHRVHRFRQGDIVAIPAGAVQWVYNDGNEEVVAVAIDDLNNPHHQLDLQSREFYLAGGASGQGRQGRRGGRQQGRGQGQQQENLQNVFAGFDPELLAEAFDVDQEVVTRMQRGNEHDLIVQIQGRLEVIRPDEQQQGQRQRQRRGGGWNTNGLEETACATKITYNLDNEREADVFSREAGKLNIANQFKLPILQFLDLGAEKGSLQPNAMVSPHWSINSHTIVYVLNGDAHIQIVSNSGDTVFDQQVNQGELFAIPQFFASTARAGQNGVEWVAFKTHRTPMNSPLAGYTSVLRGMPIEVITNSYQVSPSQAQDLKTNRGSESFLLSPQRGSSRRT